MPNPGIESVGSWGHFLIQITNIVKYQDGKPTVDSQGFGRGEGYTVESYDQNLQTGKSTVGWADSQGWGKGRVIESYDQNLQTRKCTVGWADSQGWGKGGG